MVCPNLYDIGDVLELLGLVSCPCVLRVPCILFELANNVLVITEDDLEHTFLCQKNANEFTTWTFFIAPYAYLTSIFGDTAAYLRTKASQFATNLVSLPPVFPTDWI